jgi:hypothetical protein
MEVPPVTTPQIANRSVRLRLMTGAAALALAALTGEARAQWGQEAPPPPPPGPEVQSMTVHSNRPEPVWTAPLAPGVIYTVEASGVFSVWPDQRDGVDAYYVYAPRVGPQPQVWNQLQIDDRPMYEIARGHGDPIWFNQSHVYTTTIRGAGRPVKLQILDARNGSWGDNHGHLLVRIYPHGGYAPPPAGYPPPAGGPPPPPPNEGWRRADRYLIDDGVAVAADRPEPSWTRQPLAPGAFYTIEISGSFALRQARGAGADALYAFAERHGLRAEPRPELLIDDRPLTDWLAEQGQPVPPFNPGHVYAITIRGTGRPLKLQTAESRNGTWQSASGALQVRVRRR